MTPPASKAPVGIIGGTGFYGLADAANQQWITVKSNFGKPSANLLAATIKDTPVIFIPRHGTDHSVPPGAINYRANIDALRTAGARRIIALSAVGSLQEQVRPGSFVIVSQYIDQTRLRKHSFFMDDGTVAHASMAQPTCTAQSELLAKTCGRLDIPVHPAGTYVAIEGPQFATKAESLLYQAWGGDVIGMTNMPEAKLAREAEMCYASIAMVADYDCWSDKRDAVSTNAILKTLRSNVKQAARLIKDALPALAALPDSCPANCRRAMRNAFATRSGQESWRAKLG